MNTPWILGVAGLSVAFTGQGLVTLDVILELRLEGGLWGAGAMLVGLARPAILLGGRRRAPSPHAVPSS